MSDQDKYVLHIHYRDLRGNLLWQEDMIFRRLYAVGQDLVHNSRNYRVHRVALADGVQHVNIQLADQPVPRYSGYVIHSTLRRLMDSKGSTILWNAIKAIDYQRWEQLLAAIERMNQPTLKLRLRKLNWIRAIGDDPPLMRLVRLGFELLDNDEWEVLEEQCRLSYDSEVERVRKYE